MGAEFWIPTVAAIISFAAFLFSLFKWLREREEKNQEKERAENYMKAVLKPRIRMASARRYQNILLAIWVDGERAVHDVSFGEILARDSTKIEEEFDRNYLTTMKSELRQLELEQKIIHPGEKPYLVNYVPFSTLGRMPYGLKALWVNFEIKDEAGTSYTGKDFVDFRPAEEAMPESDLVTRGNQNPGI